MEMYFLVQIIGLLGYSLLASSSYFKSRQHNLILESSACLILAAHWYFLGSPFAALGNLLWVYISLFGLSHKSNIGRYGLYAAYPLSIIFFLTIGVSSFIDVAVIAGNFLLITSRLCNSNLHYRSMIFATSLICIVNAVWFLSYPGMFFLSVFAIGHAKALYRELNQPIAVAAE